MSLRFVAFNGLAPPLIWFSVGYQSPYLNPLDYLMWPHIEVRACRVCHANVAVLKTAVDEEWTAKSGNFIVKTCQAFWRRLEAVVTTRGGYI